MKAENYSSLNRHEERLLGDLQQGVSSTVVLKYLKSEVFLLICLKLNTYSSFKGVILSSRQQITGFLHLCPMCVLGGDQPKGDTRRTAPCSCFAPQEVCI